MRPRLYTAIPLILMIVACVSPLSHAQVRFNTIALSGSTGAAVNYGPNLGSGVTFSASGFSHPSLSENGTVAFEVSLVGPGITGSNNEGFWSAQSGLLTPIVREGSANPVGTFGSVGSFSQNANNQVLFYDQASNSRWSNVSGSLSRIDQIGTDGVLGPGMGSGVVFSTYGFAASNNGKFSSMASITGPGITGNDNRGLWIHENGASSLLARIGTDGPYGPNLGSGVRLSGFGQFHTMNAGGKVSWSGFVAGTGVNANNDEAIWTNSAAGIVPIAREGAEGPLGPNMGPGVTLKSSAPAFSRENTINSLNTIAFKGFAFDSATSLTAPGIWMNKGSGNNPAVLGLTDGPLGPNMGPGTNFKAFSVIRMNANDELLFGASISGFGTGPFDSQGIWTKNSNGMNLLARTGVSGPFGPQLGADVVFSNLVPVGINNAGESLIIGVLEGPGLDFNNNTGIWATENGKLVKILQIDELFDVDPTAAIELRTIDSFALEQFGNANGEDGNLLAFNSNSMLTFGLKFTDGSSGIFTAVVPEPSFLILAIAGTFAGLFFSSVASITKRRILFVRNGSFSICQIRDKLKS